MVQELFDKNVFLYVMLGLCGFGILIKMVISLIYRLLMKASDNMASSKNKLMKLVKMKFEACYKLKIGVNNVDTFVDKYVYKYKFCGVFLYTWENIGRQILMLCLLTGAIGAGLGLVYGREQNTILSIFFMGIVTSALLIIVESFINLPAKCRIIKVNMKDYLENLLKVRLEKEYINPEMLEAYRNEYFKMEEVGKKDKKKPKKNAAATEEKQKADHNEDVYELMESLADMAAGKENIRNADKKVKKVVVHRNPVPNQFNYDENGIVRNELAAVKGETGDADFSNVAENRREGMDFSNLENPRRASRSDNSFHFDKEEEGIIEDILKEFMA